MTRQINQAGIDLIQSCESCRLEAYLDQASIWTIGWGQTGPDIGEGLVITQEQADDVFVAEVSKFCADVEQGVIVDLTDNQFAALVCLTYNIGAEAFADSTLLKLLNNGSYDLAAAQFLRWNKVGGVVNRGLDNRRARERALFLS